MNVSPFIAVYFLICGVYLIFRDWNVKKWPYVEGELVNSHVGTANKSFENFNVVDFVYESTISAHLKYVYWVNNTEYTGTRLSFSLIYGSKAVLPYLRNQLGKIEAFPNGKVKVFYNPANPKSSTLLKPDLLSQAVGLLCFPIGLFFLSIRPIVI